MNVLRRQLRSRPWLAVLALAATLLLRVLVPAGFMPSVVDGRVTLTLCSGVASAPTMAAMPGMTHGGDMHGQAQSPCAYADLSLPALGTVDAVLAVAATLFAFVLALLLAVPLPLRTPARLRPPLRGPPLPV